MAMTLKLIQSLRDCGEPRLPYTEQDALKAAVCFAGLAPCRKSQRGVILFQRDKGALSGGFNHQPPPFTCDGSAACRDACSKLCVHAEQMAINSLGPHEDLDDVELLHVETVDGKAVPSGPPSCWQCSRLIVHAGIAKVWLLHYDGLRGYGADEFHVLTLLHCGLPVIR